MVGAPALREHPGRSLLRQLLHKARKQHRAATLGVGRAIPAFENRQRARRQIASVRIDSDGEIVQDAVGQLHTRRQLVVDELIEGDALVLGEHPG